MENNYKAVRLTDSSLSRDPSEIPEKVRFEEQALFAFAKEYIGILAAVASIPLLSSLLHIIPSPVYNIADKSNDNGFSLIAAFLAVFTFGWCCLLKNFIGRLALCREWYLRVIPNAVAFALLAVSICLISTYFSLSDNQNVTLFEKILVYLAIYPTCVAAVGIITMTSYSQMEGLTMDREIGTKIKNAFQIDHLRRVISLYCNFYYVCESNKLQSLGERLLQPFEKQLANLSLGRIEVNGLETIRLQETLLDQFDKRFHAVSDRDLEFWTKQYLGVQRNELDGIIAKGYIDLCLEAQRKKVIVTRLFIISESDMVNNRQIVLSVLRLQT